MIAPFLLLTTQLLLVSVGGVDSSDHQHLHTDSFPKNDEYDIMKLEPETPYGTPYGGFSRATASRLAGLPLKLPSVSKQIDDDSGDNTFEPMYTMVRDNSGRKFACRVYHEDELEADSLGDSMFDTPRPRKTSDSESDPSPSSEPAEENIPVDSSKDENSAIRQLGDDNDPSTTTSSASNLKEVDFDPMLVGHTIQKRLAKLKGLCAQLHPHSWWSYEWCHQDTIKQFHVSVIRLNGQAKQVELESITNLGSFSGRTITVIDKDGDDDIDPKVDQSKTLAEGRKELGRVVDTFAGGDTCDATGKPRVTQAEFRCCSERNIAKNKGGVLQNGNQIKTDVVSIYEATEDKSKVCHYNITICTSLMCEDYDESETKTKVIGEKSNTKSTEGKTNKNSMLNLEIDPAEAQKLSVIEILDYTFGKSRNFCIRSDTGGWWAYEFCPGDHVRQFHEDEASVVDPLSGKIGAKKKAAPAVVTEHYLGRYKAEDHEEVTKENEWEHVVNATTSTSTLSTNHKAQGTPSPSAGGNGAYYVQEYTKGDVCDQVDVTDSAIKAGEFGEGGIERAITVRYSCNSEISVTVKEDSTCHYVIDVTVPTLCHHPLFKAPVSKRQVVKCLPVP